MILFENNSNVTERLVLELREFKEGAFIRSNTVVDLTASNGWLEKWKQIYGKKDCVGKPIRFPQQQYKLGLNNYQSCATIMSHDTYKIYM